jgi:hypothetical protein
MAVHGVSGVQMRFMGCVGWAMEDVRRGWGRVVFLVVLDLRLVMAPKLHYGMRMVWGSGPHGNFSELFCFNLL